MSAKAFTEPRASVKGHPQDTVVLFLAGHTGVFDQRALLPAAAQIPVPQGSPADGRRPQRQSPDRPGGQGHSRTTCSRTATLAVNLMRLDALNRLVIVDACQAEAILADPQVDAIRKWMEIGSRRARTSYLMAARSG